MAIKQQGGVFGRNPTFNDVNIDKLTVDGSASVNGPLDCDGFTSNGQSNFVGTLGTVFVDSQGAFLNFTRNSGNYIRTTGASSSLYINTASTNRIGIFNTGDINLYKDDGTTVGATWDASAGNLAFASGNGIDFSATSGTGTSELFDDYEEGTWTPVYDASTSSPTVTHDKQTGYYVKIGRMVFISLQLRTDSVSGGSGNLRISGLPYSASSGDGYPSALSVGYKADFVTNGPDFAHVNDGQTYLSLYSNGTTVATPLTVANLNTGSNDNGLYISGSYLTA